MTAPVRPAPDAAAVRRRVARDLYGKLALLSTVIWTLGTILLFITYAAGNPRPIPMAALAMSVPILPAALPWLLYRPLTSYLTARQLARATALPETAPPTPLGLGGSGEQRHVSRGP